MAATPETRPVACAFCGGPVDYTDDDPIGIGVVERWRPHDEEIDWMVYAHRSCFLARLDEGVREAVEH